MLGFFAAAANAGLAMKARQTTIADSTNAILFFMCSPLLKTASSNLKCNA
jgi:hypothetical protein